MNPTKFKRMIRDYPWLWAIESRAHGTTWVPERHLEIFARELKVSDLKTETSKNEDETSLEIWIYTRFTGEREAVERLHERVWERAEQATIADRIAWQLGGNTLDHDNTCIACLALQRYNVVKGTSITILRTPRGRSFTKMVRENRTPRPDRKK